MVQVTGLIGGQGGEESSHVKGTFSASIFAILSSFFIVLQLAVETTVYSY
jgi:hypothetical protein